MSDLLSKLPFDLSGFSYDLTLIGVAFWIFVAAVSVAGIWWSISRNREMQKTIRLAIEKDVQLDAGLVEALAKSRSGKPEDYYIGGITCFAVGIGLPIFGFFLKQGKPEAFLPLVGVGILVGLIGVGLVVGGRLLSRREIEKGMQIDADLIETPIKPRSGKPEDYYIGGFTCFAIGIGLPVLGLFLRQGEPEAFLPLVGVGILVGLIGASLIANGKMLSRREKVNKDGNHRV